MPEDLLEELRDTSMKFFDATSIEAYFERGQEAIDCMWAPDLVLSDLDGSSEKTPCFFKGMVNEFGMDHSLRFPSELQAYLRIQSTLRHEARVPRLLSVVHGTTTAKQGAAGLLLTCIDSRSKLETACVRRCFLTQLYLILLCRSGRPSRSSTLLTLSGE